ncbi:LPS assembly lipoprotein LptE [Piscinibacter sp. HJYY11]|uniref:LPS-assembly lipoprotein LptE n=1 Tax=Piscinibacter sp. HJYY11 TaxID=2801333 RepID=UPI002873D8EE|nr:LPS assembly lipoprotein LptE [Piscinibacter sp. HJYY11]
MINPRRSFVLGLAALSAGCGFQLRRAPELRFKTIYLSGFKPHSPLAEELRRQIASTTTTRVVEVPAQAEVVFDGQTDKRGKGVVVTTAAGEVREIQLRLHLQFRLHTLAGKELIPSTAIALTRDMTYNERDALGKEQEEEMLYRAMQSDIANQVLRRLAAVRSL